MREYTWQTIRQHNNQNSLWIVIYGRIYDLTNFHNHHPGGPDVLKLIAGQDATDEFENTLHPKKARLLAKKWLIGKVTGETLGDLFSVITDHDHQTDHVDNIVNNSSFAWKTLFFLSIVLVIAMIAYKCFKLNFVDIFFSMCRL